MNWGRGSEKKVERSLWPREEQRGEANAAIYLPTLNGIVSQALCDGIHSMRAG